MLHECAAEKRVFRGMCTRCCLICHLDAGGVSYERGRICADIADAFCANTVAGAVRGALQRPESLASPYEELSHVSRSIGSMTSETRVKRLIELKGDALTPFNLWHQDNLAFPGSEGSRQMKSSFESAFL